MAYPIDGFRYNTFLTSGENNPEKLWELTKKFFDNHKDKFIISEPHQPYVGYGFGKYLDLEYKRIYHKKWVNSDGLMIYFCM